MDLGSRIQKGLTNHFQRQWNQGLTQPYAWLLIALGAIGCLLWFPFWTPELLKDEQMHIKKYKILHKNGVHLGNAKLEMVRRVPCYCSYILLLKARPCRGSWAQEDFLFHLHNLPWVLKGRLKKLLSRKGKDSESWEEQPRNSTALGRGPSSTSKDTHNNILNPIYRIKTQQWKVSAFSIWEKTTWGQTNGTTGAH